MFEVRQLVEKTLSAEKKCKQNSVSKKMAELKEKILRRWSG